MALLSAWHRWSVPAAHRLKAHGRLTELCACLGPWLGVTPEGGGRPRPGLPRPQIHPGASSPPKSFAVQALFLQQLEKTPSRRALVAPLGGGLGDDTHQELATVFHSCTQPPLTFCLQTLFKAALDETLRRLPGLVAPVAGGQNRKLASHSGFIEVGAASD